MYLSFATVSVIWSALSVNAKICGLDRAKRRMAATAELKRLEHSSTPTTPALASHASVAATTAQPKGDVCTVEIWELQERLKRQLSKARAQIK